MQEDELFIRLILPSGVKEIRGNREDVIERMYQLVSLESDIGKSYAEITKIGSSNKKTQEQLELKE